MVEVGEIGVDGRRECIWVGCHCGAPAAAGTGVLRALVAADKTGEPVRGPRAVEAGKAEIPERGQIREMIRKPTSDKRICANRLWALGVLQISTFDTFRKNVKFQTGCQLPECKLKVQHRSHLTLSKNKASLLLFCVVSLKKKVLTM